MNRLSNVTSQLTVVANPLAPTHATHADRSSYRYKTTPWRAWYTSKKWMKLRKKILHRDNYTCTEPSCGILLVHKTHLLVAHHTQQHKGDPLLFWNEKIIKTVCKKCHDGIIQSREREAEMKGR